MKKKEVKEVQNKEGLLKEKNELLKELATMSVEFKLNKPTDTNTLSKKKKRLAVINTLMRNEELKTNN